MGKAATSVGAQAFVHPAKGGVCVKLRVSPGAKCTAIKGLYGNGAVRLSAAAPPVEGRANAEVERYMARLFGLSRSEVALVKGASNRDKLVSVRGLRPDEVRTRLSALL
ncbi:MAG: hypothetical protein AVDCRST_MAG80-1867 [uncultured Rubrobacteraceae bacterium]|uniref:UPF0235 protein AVDCRST_MAG80-1867 n=1 Tax=uncultured Rubrobacteraceae bacterium TaxID=349277 RepID=A0A6J4QN85_9ACTN|nr:MAG: hypothetical protein AVDCRST_MAG80-1867 [uncultured Rubrobacteraceae bacterium]